METLPKILYIDDEPENLVGFQVSFSKHFLIHTVSNTTQGYELLKSVEFSIVLIDYKMPGEDGISFIERIKQEFPDVVFIIVSGFADLDIVIKAINMNCFYNFVQKPWNYNELKIVLNNAVELHEIKKERKALMAQLLINNQQLEESVNREKKMNSLKNVFLQNISHEIRTPLNSIIGFANLALEETKEENVAKNIHICINSSYKLLKTVEDIVAASIIISDQSKTSVEEFQFKTLVKELIPVRTLRGHHGNTLNSVDFIDNIDDNLQLINDKDKILTVIDLLIDNAFKFTDVGFVKIDATKLSDEEILVSIQDTGIGIEPEKIPLLFEPFRQGDETNTRKYGGTGLGLFIAKSYVELLEGKIWCESKSGIGTTIYFTVKRNLKTTKTNFPTALKSTIE